MQAAVQKKYMWECPNCSSRFFSEPVTLGVRNGRLTRIPPICDKCFKSCSCGQRQPYGEYCQVCGDSRTRVNLIRHEIDPDDPTFGITSTGSSSAPTTTQQTATGTTGSDMAAAVFACAFSMAVAGTVETMGVYITSAVAKNFVCGLYTDSSSLPNGLLGQTGEISANGVGWRTGVMAIRVYLAIGTYWMAAHGNSLGAVTGSTNSGSTKYRNISYTGTLPNPFGTTTNLANWTMDLEIIFVKVKGYAKLTKATLSEAAGSVTSISLYFHATGNFYAGIYTDSSGPAVLKWTSASTPATGGGAWDTVLISAGIPNTLALAAGDYWLAWQWDSVNAGPSYTLGGANTGAYLAQAYGAFPDPMTGETLSTETWSLYVTYVVTYVTGVVRDGATGTPIEGATVWLFKTSDKSYVGTDTSDVNGAYSIPVSDTVTEHFVRAFKDGSNVFGTTDDDLVGA